MNSKKAVLLDLGLIGALVLALLLHYHAFDLETAGHVFIITISIAGVLPVVYSAWQALKNRHLSIDLLASVALIFSLLARDWASAIFINLMLACARIFADYTEGQARRALKSLLKLRPREALVRREGRIERVPTGQLRPGDLVLVELGQSVPVDGIIVEGEASLDQSSLTGESLPVDKKVGDRALSSTVVTSGNLLIKAERVGRSTMLERMIILVEEAAGSKARINTIADAFTQWYIAIIFISSILLYLFFQDTRLVLAVLLVVCADDIAVAIPLAFLAAVGYAARRGVIIKGANFLEGLAKMKVLIMDKTGTLTLGHLRVENYFIFNDYSDRDFWRIAGEACQSSTHPTARAISDYVKTKELEIMAPDRSEEKSGLGSVAYYGARRVLSGKIPLFENLGLEVSGEIKHKIEKEKDRGYSVVLIGENNQAIGLFALADEIKPRVKVVITRLKQLGVEKIVMLTGDSEPIAEKIASETGVDDFHANLLPQDKVNYVKKYLNKKTKVGMVGDGVNDAASLALADIGIAMGGIGTDAAIESADIVLMKDDLNRLPEMIELSRYVLKIARQNFWIWGVVNAIGLTLVFLGLLAPAGAAAFNFATDFIPLFNSLRLFQLHLRPLKLSRID